MRPVLLCLHGWGGTKESFTELRGALNGVDVEILTADLPGFGEEPEPSRPWNTDDYADWVEKFLEQKTKNEKASKRQLYILGHSHGGRIAMKLASRQTKNEKRETRNYAIAHLYLCAAAGIRRPRHFKRIVGLTLAKAGKFFLSIPGLKHLQPLGKKFLYQLVRVHDYEKASPLMRETLRRVTAEDLRPLLPEISVPTDIFWGEEDRMTPLKDAHVIHNGIRGSVLHTYPGIRHRVHREKAAEIAAVIQQYLRTADT